MRLGVRAPRRGRGKVRFPTKNQLPRGSYLTLLGRIPYEAQVVISVLLSLLTKQTKDLPVFSAQEEEFLPMLPTEILLPPVLWAHPDLSGMLHDAGQTLLRSQVPQGVADTTHGTATRLPAVRDAGGGRSRGHSLDGGVLSKAPGRRNSSPPSV